MKKVKIFLADMVHTKERSSNWNMPLNFGYITTYAQKHAADASKLEFKVFKRPELLLEAIRKKSPDILGLSYYIWNVNLNCYIFSVAKQLNPHILNVGGGPNVSDLYFNEARAKKPFAEQKHCDAYVVNQGEQGFVKLLD